MARTAKLNPQALARKDKGFLSCVIPDEDEIFVSIDLASGEPTVTSHFSQDRHYCYACFDGVGKAPYYANGVLMISDIYFQTMSVSPLHREMLAYAFANERFEGRTFAEQWLVDDEVIKKRFKAERQLSKMICLALSYGLGPTKMVKQCFENGHLMTLETARAFFGAYWELYSGVREFGKRLEKQFARDGHLVNPFGYRLKPDKAFKCMNFFVQSSVSGIMHVFVAKIMAISPYAKFVTVIHDELIAQLPVARLDDFRKAKDDATASLNADLKWSVNIRTGFAPGFDLYSAK